MSNFFNMIGQHLSANAGAYGTGLVALALASIRCMPQPGASFTGKTLYGWVYETLQTVLPTPRPTNPLPPVGPATTK